MLSWILSNNAGPMGIRPKIAIMKRAFVNFVPAKRLSKNKKKKNMSMFSLIENQK